MAAKKQYKLDLKSVLQAIDRKDFSFYSRLSDEDKKGYSPRVLMRFMSSVTDQNKNSIFSILFVNDIVNVGFWQLSKFPDLQHLLLCLAGLGGKQYRPWLPTKNDKKTNKIDSFIMENNPGINSDELNIIKNTYDLNSWTKMVKSSGLSDPDTKILIDEWKKKEK